ncbi:MAG TPA: hypothetical protein VMU83_16645 [Hanamia sp.]|nr:hypothetical protein [Hanamia sp.]
MFDTLSNKQIIDVISGNVVGKLGCKADGKTYVVPISYAYDGDYIVSARKRYNPLLQKDTAE